MEPFLFGLYAVIVVGSLCGLRAALRLGALAHRIATIERRLSLGEASRAPALHAPARANEPPALHAPAGADGPPVLRAPALRAPAAGRTSPAAAPPPKIVAGGLASSAAGPRLAFAGTAEPPATAASLPRSAEDDWWHSLELRAGTRWITWLGAGALVIGAALFVKLAIARGWLGPAARLGLGVAAGIGLLFAGRRAHRAQMRPLAQGLSGAGLGVLYVATYVAFASYGLIARELVFTAMIGVTIAGCAIALRHDAQPIAVLALLGGLLTPVAVSSGGGSRDALLAYLLVLDLGAVAIALVRRWRALELIALAGTWVLFGGWLAHAQAHAAAFGPAELAWLAVLHLVFAALPLAFHLRLGLGAARGRRLAAIVNAAAALACAAEILDGQRRAVGTAALGMAAMYAALDALARRRLAGGDRARFGFVPLAALLATLSAALWLRGHGLTLAWSLEALVLLVLGFHDRRASIRLAALGVLALAMLHGVGSHAPSHAAGFRPFVNPAFAGALLAPLAAGLFAWIHGALRERGDARGRWHGIAAALAGGAVLLALAHTEIARWFALEGRPDLGKAALSTLWAGGSLIALGVALRRTPPPAAVAGACAAAALFAAGLCIEAYGAPADPSALLALNLRFAGALLTSSALAANAAALARRDHTWGRLAWAAAIAGLGAAIGAEAYLHHAALDPLVRAGFRAHTALSLAWSGYAALLLAIGFVRRRRPLRLAGLALLGLVAAKLLLIDLAGAPQAYRVLSFLIAGALMIAVSYAYHRLERRPDPPEV